MILSQGARLAIAAGTLVAASAGVSACGSGDGDAEGDAKGDATTALAATTALWADVTSHVACGEPVSAIIPPGDDPHSFEPSLRDREQLSAADLVVANGAGLEQQLADLLGAVAEGGVPVLQVADHVDLIGDSAGDDDDDSGGHGRGADPHLWEDPTRVAGALDAIAEALVGAGRDPAAIADCTAEYRVDLLALDAEIRELVAAIPPASRLLVTNHDSLRYFAERYGFTVLGSVIPSTSTLAEASAAELADLADQIRERGVPAIFVEATESDVDARALARRLGVEVVGLRTSSVGGDGGESYVAMMRDNATAIAQALAP